MNSTPWDVIDAETLRRIDLEARNRCAGDVALWEHHRALLEGACRAQAQGDNAYGVYVLVGNLPQFKSVEASVIEGWRIYVERALGIQAHRTATRPCAQPNSGIRERVVYLSKDLQADDYEVNYALILDGCRSARSDKEAAELLQERAQSIHVFAEDGNVQFFRRLGRILNDPHTGTMHVRHRYARTLLSLWLPSFLWLMPEKLAADQLAIWLGSRPITGTDSQKALRRFKKTKAEYGLFAHEPSLVAEVTTDGKLIATPDGEKLLNSLLPPR